jgi:hypothetical protein
LWAKNGPEQVRQILHNGTAENRRERLLKVK